MFHEGFVFSGTNPPEFQESALQNTSFPFGGSRLRTQVSRFSRDDYSETWTPGNCRSPCRGTQVSRSLRDICSETRRAPNEVGYLNEQTLHFSFPSFRSPRLGTHASRSSGDICSETRTPGNFSGPRRGTQASLSSRNKYSETRIRELELYIGP